MHPLIEKVADAPNIGEHVKIFLPGESPWATIVSAHEDGRLAVRIDNHLIGTLHGYKYGDVVTVERETTQDWSIWKLAALDRQLPILKVVSNG